MKTVDKQKICVHCDGRLPLDATQCIYCGAEVKPEAAAPKTSVLFANQSLQDSLASLYTPPYSVKSPHFSPAVDKKRQESAEPPPVKTESIVQKKVPEEQAQSVMPLLTLLAGAQIFTLGLLQLLFSDEGILRLEWNSQYWFIYCLSALPLFYFGIKRSK